MKLTDVLDIRGRLTIQKRDLDDRLIDTVAANNSIVKTGRELIAKLFFNKDIQPISLIGVGTGQNSVMPENNQLEKQLGSFKAIKAVDPNDLAWVTIDNVPRLRLTIAADLEPGECNGPLTEAGLFNQNKVMYNRVVFPTINKSADFKLTLVWEIVF